MLAQKIGKIDISELNIPPNKDELGTARFFATKGKDIKFIRPSNMKGDHKADFWMDGIRWEVKNPHGSSSRNIEDRIRKAKKQSNYIIIDLRHSKMSDVEAIRRIKTEFGNFKNIKSIKIIAKKNKVIDLKR